MKQDLSIKVVDGKYVVCSNEKPIELPKTDGASIVTAFDTQQDAERYISILQMLRNRK